MLKTLVSKTARAIARRNTRLADRHKQAALRCAEAALWWTEVERSADGAPTAEADNRSILAIAVLMTLAVAGFFVALSIIRGQL